MATPWGVGACEVGFTLLEVLVVLLIIGISLGVMVLNLNPGQQAAAEEGKRLANLLSLAREEAILNGSEWAVEVEPAGYRFLVLDGEKWQPLAEDEIFRPRTLPAELTITLTIEGEAIPLLNLDDKTRKPGQEEIPPRLNLFSSGEATPARIELANPVSAAKETVAISPTGKITLGDPTPP